MLLRSLHRYIDRNRVYHSLFVQYIGITLMLLHNYCNCYVGADVIFLYLVFIDKIHQKQHHKYRCHPYH